MICEKCGKDYSDAVCFIHRETCEGKKAGRPPSTNSKDTKEEILKTDGKK